MWLLKWAKSAAERSSWKRRWCPAAWKRAYSRGWWSSTTRSSPRPRTAGVWTTIPKARTPIGSLSSKNLPDCRRRSDNLDPILVMKQLFSYTRGLGRLIAFACAVLLPHASSVLPAATDSNQAERKLLYVAVPGIRNYLEYGGHGVLVFDIDHGHRFVKRIPAAGLDEGGQPLNVKGVCANASTKRLYVGTTRTLTCFDLLSEKILWEKPYPGGCDRMSITPDGKAIYLPSLEGAHWHVVDGLTGDVIKKILPKSVGAHNTIVGMDKRHAYLAGLRSPLLSVTDAQKHEVIREVGPFSHFIRPFTVNGSGTLCF